VRKQHLLVRKQHFLVQKRHFLHPERYLLHPERHFLHPERLRLHPERHFLHPERFMPCDSSLPSTSPGIWDLAKYTVLSLLVYAFPLLTTLCILILHQKKYIFNNH
jgi:hypothetical protein